MASAGENLFGGGGTDVTNPQGSLLNPMGFVLNNKTRDSLNPFKDGNIGDFLKQPFGTGNYNVSQGLPGFIQGSDAQALQNAQNNSQSSIGQQQAFLNALNGNGLNANQAGILGQQQGLANQLNLQARGEGPNPAVAQLAQNTGQNVQQQAALMASARGSQANPGLVTRQAAQQGGALQQQAVGQAATMRAQQQIAAQQSLMGQQNQMANLATAGVGQRQAGVSQLANQNLNYQQMLQNALTSQNQQQVQTQIGQASLAGIGMNNTAGLIGGGMNAFGSILSGPMSSMFAKGGIVPQHFDLGGAATGAGAGMIASQSPEDVQEKADAGLPKSNLAQYSQGQDNQAGSVGTNGSGAAALYQGMSSFGKSMSGQNKQGGGGGGAAGLMSMAALLSKGGKINGQAKTKGDSLKNDTVPAMLSPGEVVIPRSHVDDPHKVAAFLNHLMGYNLKVA